MNRVQAQRAAIIRTLEAIPDIGRVQPYERYARNSAQLMEFYGTVIDGRKELRGWFVRRVATQSISPALGRTLEAYQWRIRGYMGLADEQESELVFDDLIEDIRDAFRTDETLDGTVATTVTPEAAGVQLIESGPVMFAGVLCHAASLVLPTQIYL